MGYKDHMGVMHMGYKDHMGVRHMGYKDHMGQAHLYMCRVMACGGLWPLVVSTISQLSG